MANFKRGKSKNARAGCLMCKPHKMTGYTKSLERPFSELRKLPLEGKARERYEK